ncbi:MAG: membrane protein insertion efficiency factor YidD [Oscillospiraceae bacterium]|nr:membrane protein insertion efficiency factor YidD [Oscillospiraceae bacterium]
MKRVLIGLVRFYRKHLSNPQVPRCRFFPTCSSYALESLEKYGALKGSLLAFGRLLKCHPFHKGGIDPVP